MCSNPLDMKDGITVACRKCDECLAARKNDWVARAVAETQVHEWAGVFNLTYQSKGRALDGARAFRYKDVQDWLKLLREAVAKDLGRRPEFRYMICGERGSVKGRVHWHCIVWCEVDLWKYGQWADFWEQWNAGLLPSDGPREEYKADPYPDPKRKLIWSAWPHGIVTIDKANEAAISYALKYILKDQFNVVNSKGTGRFTKSELSGSSFFRMSKKPPIGLTWLDHQLEAWEKAGAVPTGLHLKIPAYSWFWWPRGLMRDYVLDGIRDINESIKEKHGRNAPQWSTLLASLDTEALENDYCRLVFGPEFDEIIERERDVKEIKEIEKKYETAKGRETFATKSIAIEKKCGGIEACEGCRRVIEATGQAGLYRAWQQAIREESEGSSERNSNADAYWRAKYVYNPFCLDKNEPSHRRREIVQKAPSGKERRYWVGPYLKPETRTPQWFVDYRNARKKTGL